MDHRESLETVIYGPGKDVTQRRSPSCEGIFNSTRYPCGCRCIRFAARLINHFQPLVNVTKDSIRCPVYEKRTLCSDCAAPSFLPFSFRDPFYRKQPLQTKKAFITDASRRSKFQLYGFDLYFSSFSRRQANIQGITPDL